MNQRIQRSLRRQRQLAFHWLMTITSFAMIAGIALRQMGG